MIGPPWLRGCLAVLMLVIAACFMARLLVFRVRGRRGEPEADLLHVLMGVAMAGMLESRLSAIPPGVWLAVFGSASAWFAVQAIRTRIRQHSGGREWAHPAPHAVECAAMFYMLWPAGLSGHDHSAAMAGMSGAAPSPNPAIALVLSLFMLGYILWTTDQLASAGGTAVLASRVATLSKITMSAAMIYMLVAMV